MRTFFRTASAALALSIAAVGAAPALAQDGGDPSTIRNTDDGGDFVLVGLGAALLPDYEGSDDYSVSPVPGAIGRVSGFNFMLAGNRLSVDLVPDNYGPGIDFQAGPVAVLNLNRASTKGIDDDRIKALGKRDAAIELGGYLGIAKTGVLTSEFDRVSASVSYRTGVSGAHSAGIFTPTVSYMTPLSTTSVVSVFASAERAERGYARSYFGITPEQSLDSGLPVYNARGGWKNWTLGAVGAKSLTGDLRHGLQAFGGVVYRRMLNDFADSPVTRIAGDRDQWLGTLGLAYSF
ncbi:MipA/OmpV family protein [Sphingomonas sp. ac-8]|uniref:MipA/OmpV family protein n=1 Tax=Sphingomonas sp. ac-8 TaxID=3242977 RepID=UPI003A80F0CB